MAEQVAISKPRVKRPPEVSIEAFGMICISRIPTLSTGLSQNFYWWLLHLGQGKTLVWPGSTSWAILLGTTRQHIGRILKELAEFDLIKLQYFTDKKVIQTITPVVPDEVDEELMQEFILITRQIFPSVIHAENGRKKDKKVEQSDPVIISDSPDLKIQPSNDANLDSSPSQEKPLKATRAKLTSENVAKIVANLDSITAYLLYGMPGVNELDQEKRKLLPPAKLNWRQFKIGDENNETSTGVMHWTANHFAGFFWYRVSVWRSQRNIGHSLPVWGRVLGNISSLMKQQTKWSLFGYIIALTDNFDLICCMIGKMTETMPLDESVLTHATFRNHANQFCKFGDSQKQSLLNQYAEMIQQRTAYFQIK